MLTCRVAAIDSRHTIQEFRDGLCRGTLYQHFATENTPSAAFMTTAKYRAISLFSGGMGLDIGLEQTGRFDVLAAVEEKSAFCKTIETNRDASLTSCGNMVVYHTDIRNLNPTKVMADLDLQSGEVDLLVGGPPCQSFSTTGRRRTVQDPRGTLLWRFLQYVAEVRPKFFVMENVRGLMSAALRHRPIEDRPEHGGPPLEPDEEPGSVVRAFVEDLNGEYRLDCFEVNAVNYGAPQLRERAIFIGNRFNRLTEFPEPTHGQDSQPVQPELFAKQSLLPFRTLGDALHGLHDPDPIVMDFSPRKKEILAMVPTGGNWRTLPEAIAMESMGQAYFAKGGRSGWWRRLSFDLPCPTIVTMPNHAGTALCHPIEVRALSLRECARVQEFPDEWVFCGRTSEQYAQIGNAVPIRLGRVIGNLLAAQLDALYASDFLVAAGHPSPFRVVYVKSHIRTRQWFRGGQEFIWRDGGENGHARYSAPKTRRKIKVI